MTAPQPVNTPRDAWAALQMISEAVETLFGPRASLESDEATLLRGPEFHHRATAIIEALQRVSKPRQRKRGPYRSGQVRCVQTGTVYPNAAAAADAADTSPATMSNHLAGRKGYRTIAGLQYERITP